MKKWLKVVGGIFAMLFCLLAWGVAAMDYGDSVAAGIYSFKGDGETSALKLNSDHTFRQTRKRGGDKRQAEGTWRRVGQGGISFSKEFLVVAGDEPEPDGTTFCDMHKLLGLFPSLKLRQYHVLWYGKTSLGSSPIGTYKGDEPNVFATLSLNEDHSLVQTLMRSDVTTCKWNMEPRFRWNGLVLQGLPEDFRGVTVRRTNVRHPWTRKALIFR